MLLAMEEFEDGKTWEMGSLDVESSLSALQVDPPEAPWGGQCGL